MSLPAGSGRLSMVLAIDVESAPLLSVTAPASRPRLTSASFSGAPGMECAGFGGGVRFGGNMGGGCGPRGGEGVLGMVLPEGFVGLVLVLVFGAALLILSFEVVGVLENLKYGDRTKVVGGVLFGLLVEATIASSPSALLLLLGSLVRVRGGSKSSSASM